MPMCNINGNSKGSESLRAGVITRVPSCSRGGVPVCVYLHADVYPLPVSLFGFLRATPVASDRDPAHVVHACDPYMRETRAVRHAGVCVRP